MQQDYILVTLNTSRRYGILRLDSIVIFLVEDN